MQSTSQSSVNFSPKVNWSHVAGFLGLTFGLTWLLDFVIYLNGGLSNPSIGMLLQFQMLLPAFSAMLLGLFFFKESPIHRQTNRTASRWFVYFYLLFTVLYLVGAIVSLTQPTQATIINSSLLGVSVIGLILLILLRIKGGKEAFTSTGLAGGRWQVWLIYGLGVIAFHGLQTLLNYVFKLGKVVDITTAFPQLATANLPPGALVLILALQTVIIGPFLGLVISFGEEYGWRGYLQTELTRLGRVRGIFILGVIWGVWHWPIIWMGYNYPGQPVVGSLSMTAVCIILAYVLGYAVFKSKGIWTAAYLHALSNQSLSFFMLMMFMPTNILFSFGIGLPGLALGTIIVLLILRDPIWKVTE